MSVEGPRARPLQFFTGKGGVGKTTLVVGAALAHAARGRRPLVVELGHGASVPGVLGDRAALGWSPRSIAPGVHAVHADGERAIVEVLGRWIGGRALASRALRAEALRAFVGAAPGVHEVAIAERLVGLLDEGWGPILVDAEASGHARMFFSWPEVLASLDAGGPVRTLLERARSTFADPARAAVHLVTTSAALPLVETLELDAALRGSGAVARGVIAVSAVPERPAVDEARLSRLARDAASEGAVSVSAALEVASRRAARDAAARRRVAAFAARVRGGIVTLPVVAAPGDVGSLSALGARFLDAPTDEVFDG